MEKETTKDPEKIIGSEKMEEEKTITFKYKFNDDYAPIYANGAYGGINPKGEVVINFFTERLPIPNSEKCEIRSDGTLGFPIEYDPEVMPILRTVSCGIILTKENAKEIYNWLGTVLGVK